MTKPTPAQITGFAALLALGALAGFGARALGLPLPFLLGGLAGGLSAIFLLSYTPTPAAYPKPLRIVFVGVIGTMIGGTFTPDLVAILPQLPLTLAAVTGFVLVAHTTGFVICRKLGRYDRPTAFFSSMPGGLVEGILLGEQSGGDVRILTLQHFTRVMFVAVAVPLVFWAWNGEAVGSAAGESIARGASGPLPVLIIAAITGIGIIAGKWLRLPASHMMGPMLLGAALQGSGVLQVAGPDWLLATAQLLVGVGLAMQMTGTTWALAGRVVAVALTMVITMLLIGLSIATALAAVTSIQPEALVLSLAPGGIAEMGLIALSLNLSPVIVAAHHVYRIALTVLIASFGARLLQKPETQTKGRS